MHGSELIKEKREEIYRIAAAHGVTEIKVFGSVARGEDSDTSDIDFLVELEEGRSLFDLGGLLMDLRDALQCEVDIVTTGSLRAPSKERVLREARSI